MFKSREKQPLKKIFILTNGRSGSNYLVDVLNQHPKIFNYGEVLGPWSKKRKLKSLFRIKEESEYLNFIYSSKWMFWISQFFYKLKHKKNYNFRSYKNIDFVGIKDFGINIQRYKLRDWLIENKDVQIIHLYRINQLDRYISLLAMQESGVVSTGKQASNNKITIDCKKMLEALETYENEMNFQFELANEIESSRVYEISYEDLFLTDKKQQIIDGMFSFLGIESTKTIDRHKKILSHNLEDKIANYSELKKSLRNTRFEKYLGLAK